MAAYAVAIVRATWFGQGIKEYFQLIDETFAPLPGNCRVHGAPYQPLEGSWSGDLVVIEFPSMGMAKSWYESAASKAIRSFRINNTEGDVLLVQGVSDGHRARIFSAKNAATRSNNSIKPKLLGGSA